MIRVLHIFRCMNRGGAETITMNVYRKIDKNKIQFDFLCMSDEDGDYDEEIKKLGGRIFRIAPPSNRGYVKHIKDIIKICKNQGPYKAIHAPTLFHSGIACLAGYLAKVPIRISHAHNTKMGKKGLLCEIYKISCRMLITCFATDKIACGEKARDFLYGKSKKTEEEVMILKNGIDLDEYIKITRNDIENIKEEFKIDTRYFVIGHVGRFDEVKNHDFFILLAEEYKRRKEYIKIVLVGDGKLKNKFELKIKEKKLEEYFIITGKRNDIPVIMNMIDVFVMPSLYEGFPMVIIEALAAGKNCVVSDTVSKETEIISDSVRFVSLKDSIEYWVKEIEKQSKKQVNKGKNIYVLEEKGFSVRRTTATLEKIYLR